MPHGAKVKWVEWMIRIRMITSISVAAIYIGRPWVGAGVYAHCHIPAVVDVNVGISPVVDIGIGVSPVVDIGIGVPPVVDIGTGVSPVVDIHIP
jgi:hypothetical protein